VVGTASVEQQIAIGDLRLVIQRPADAAALVSEEAFGVDEYLPYWAELWPSGLALAHHLSRMDLCGLAVLELGCGLALPSMVAARRGAATVATDWSQDAIEQLVRNAERNAAVLTTRCADWSDPLAFEAAAFDLVVAADVLYEKRNARPVLNTIARALRRGGQAIVADPGRRHAPDALGTARRDGWAVSSVPDDRLPNGALHTLTPPAGAQAHSWHKPGTDTKHLQR
jgi:predicted nicotinamide N-methyase